MFFSPVNLWEIGTKSSIWPEYGIQAVDNIYTAGLKANLQELLITSADMIAATQLPQIHKDPFDRILIAQSYNNGCHLITVDNKIALYQMPYLMIV